MKCSKGMREWLIAYGYAQEGAADEQLAKSLDNALKDGVLTYEQIAAIEAKPLAEAMKMAAEIVGKHNAEPTSTSVFGGKGAPTIRVKATSEMYDGTRQKGFHVRTKLPVKGFDGKDVETPSQRDLAKIGVWAKMLYARSGGSVTLGEHDRSLLNEIFATEKFAGEVDGQYEQHVPGMRVKDLLADTGAGTSGGGYLTPYFFDNNLVTFPLLNGQIFPFVDIRDIPRGNLVLGATMGNPSVRWNEAEGTSMTLFDTASLVGQLSTTIFPVDCAITIGRDLLADSLVDTGAYIQENVGQSMMKDLDRVVVSGNGTGEPVGITNSGITNIIPSVGGTSGLVNLADLEHLMFQGVEMQYRIPSLRPCFISNEATYSRFRAIPVGTDDARRVLGEDEGSHTALNWPWRIYQGLNDNTAIYGCLAKYRMFRRDGGELLFTNQGQTLALKHETLFIYRARYGGRVVDTNAFGIVDDLSANG